MTEKISSTQRPPVIVVLGHVDHGKTTLLDYIRSANVAAKEAGGITQSIGAYEITREGRKLTFIDTPGHAAFSAMRVRGAKLADIAILVVAADDGVQPQTKEAIKVLQSEKTPFIVAITKIDKNGVDATKAKNDLTAENVLLEGYGGNISFQEVSGKTGDGVDDLIELVILTADLIELPVDNEQSGKGVILESNLDSRRGIIASGIVLNGTLRAGDAITAGEVSGKVKGLENFLGERIKEAKASSPVLILGFDALPEIGAEFISGGAVQKTAEKAVGKPQATAIQTVGEDAKSLNLVLRGDVSGSLEVLTQELLKPTTSLR